MNVIQKKKFSQRAPTLGKRERTDLQEAYAIKATPVVKTVHTEENHMPETQTGKNKRSHTLISSLGKEQSHSKSQRIQSKEVSTGSQKTTASTFQSSLRASLPTSRHEASSIGKPIAMSSGLPIETKAEMTHSSFEVINFGCRLNAYEADIIRERAQEQNLQNALIFNTCAVTSEAVREVRQTIRRFHRKHPEARIIVTGCAAQIDPQSFADMPEVDRVLGNHEKLQSASFAPELFEGSEKVRVNDIQLVRETTPHLQAAFQPRMRAFVQVQNGCDHRCTFCIIPYGRGPSRSVPAGEVVREIQKLVMTGYQEVILSGVDISSWGQDLPGTPELGDLVKRILKLVPDLERLRLSSIDAAEIDPVLFALFAQESRLMPYLHLSLQAGDNLILKRMKRRHLRENAIELCQALRKVRPEIAFGADIIAGFPTETEAHFQNSLALVDECGLQFLHVFPYSVREGTPAARMPQNPKAIIKERAARLRQKGQKILQQHFKACQGKTVSLLMEKKGFGRAEDFSPVQIASYSSVKPCLRAQNTQKALQTPQQAGQKQVSSEQVSSEQVSLGQVYQAHITGYTEKAFLAELSL